jgi:hypothetical protein
MTKLTGYRPEAGAEIRSVENWVIFHRNHITTAVSLNVIKY